MIFSLLVLFCCKTLLNEKVKVFGILMLFAYLFDGISFDWNAKAFDAQWRLTDLL